MSLLTPFESVTVKVAVLSPGVDKSRVPFFHTTFVFEGNSVPSAERTKSRAINVAEFSPAIA